MAKPDLPNPSMYGWEAVDNSLLPITTDSLPASKAVIEMTVCSCKTKCLTNRCKCRKNNLKCTDMCLCIDCENDEQCNDSSSENESESDDE